MNKSISISSMSNLSDSPTICILKAFREQTEIRVFPMSSSPNEVRIGLQGIHSDFKSPCDSNENKNSNSGERSHEIA